MKDTGRHNLKKSIIALLAVLICSGPVSAQQAAIVKNDMQIDGSDPGIKIFIREKMAQGNTRFASDNVVLFLHGATGPSTCDFDLQYKDYSWADWLVKRGYVVYMGDYRNYGGSTREAAMDEPASKNQPVTRSYLALRDIEAMVNHIKRTNRQLLKESQHIAPLQFAANDHLAISINAMHLKNRLRNIQTDCLNCLHDWLL
jgi:hypothetical protein